MHETLSARALREENTLADETVHRDRLGHRATWSLESTTYYAFDIIPEGHIVVSPATGDEMLNFGPRGPSEALPSSLQRCMSMSGSMRLRLPGVAEAPGS